VPRPLTKKALSTQEVIDPDRQIHETGSSFNLELRLWFCI